MQFNWVFPLLFNKTILLVPSCVPAWRLSVCTWPWRGCAAGGTGAWWFATGWPCTGFDGGLFLRRRNTFAFGRARTGKEEWLVTLDRNSILMTRHNPDLGSASDWLKQISHAARPIRSTTQIWVVTRHQYGISALVSQTSFRGETSGDIAKRQLFSQAKTVQYIPGGFWTILLFLDCH